MAKLKPGRRKTDRIQPVRYSSYSPDAIRTDALSRGEIETADKKGFWHYPLRFLLGFLIIVFSLAIIIGVWDARNISSASRKMFGSGSLFDLLSTSQLKGSENGRVNILLVGYSIDDPGHPAAKLTDSLILLSMSTSSHTGYMLSIPRDLYVKIPGFGYAKINEAYQDGGISLLEQVITSAFEQPINYYALINYATVRDTVNALGGITVNIQSADPRGLYDPNISTHDGGPLKLANGVQSINGQTALNLTRARGDGFGSYGFAQADFDRTQHQREILSAIKAKLNWKLVLNPHQNSQLLNAVASNVKTDIQADEIRSVFGLFNSIPNSSLRSVGLRDFNGENYLSGYTTPYGQSALIPNTGINDYSQIDAALAQISM